MFGFVIGDHDMVIGFRLVGVKGVEVNSSEMARRSFAEALERKDIAIVFISQNFSSQIRNDIEKARLERRTPIIVEIPGSRGPKEETRLSDIVSKSLGMRI